METEREGPGRPPKRAGGRAGELKGAAGRGPDGRERAHSHRSAFAGRRDETQRSEDKERAKQVMRRLLSVRMRSRRELELRLAQRRFRREVIADALDDFERVGLVNDKEFAKLFLESRFRLRPRSYNMLLHELRAKGLADELIKEVVNECRNEVTEEELARRALGARLKSIKRGSADEAKARAARFLAGRGFARSLIVEVVKDI